MVRLFLRESEICSVCQKHCGKYQCPRCQKHYCNSQCYKTHNSECTESFYKHQVEVWLTDKKAANPQKMLKILEKFKETPTPDCLTEQDEKRLQMLLEHAESPSVFGLMTEMERAEFIQFVTQNYSEAQWEPWWDKICATPSVQPTDQTFQKYNDLPPLQSLTSKSPSFSVVYYVCKAAWSFAYVWRLYNGDEENTPEMLELVSHLSGLGTRSKTSYLNLQAAVNSCVQKAYDTDRVAARVFTRIALSDLRTLLCKGNLVELLFKLYDMYHFLPLRQFKGRTKKVDFIKQKVFFYLCFVKQTPDTVIAQVRDEAERYFDDFPLKSN